MNNQVFFSNRISSLAHVLGENLFQGDPLACRYVVIPNDQVKRFLIEYFADQWGIAAGIRFVQLSEMIKIVLMANFPKLKIPSSLELSFHIERAMKNFLKDSQIPEKSLVAYIKKAKDPEKRIRGLSVQLSKLFVKYGVADSIEWKEGWQKVLWDVTFTGSGLTLPCMLEKLSFPHPIHFFYLSNLTSVQCELFSKIDCTFYQWSPCLFYWEDIKSDKERLFQKKKAGKFAEELDQYLKETNRFLANFGKVGRKWAQITSRYDWVEDEQYCVAEEPNTMLEQLQSDLLMLKEPGKFVVDDSIKVHAASCKRREVEVVKEQICRWLEKGVEPKEVLIMAPDIMEYAPYLEMVFEEWVSIGDLNKGARSVLVGAFTHLIGMESFDVMEVFTLFHFSCFQKKFGLSRDDVEKMQKWVEKADIRRGIKSWENGFARLLHGLAYSGDEYALEVVPVDCVEFSDAPLLGTLIDVVRLLEKELGKESRSLEKWLTYFRGLIEKFFVVSSEDEWFVRELETIGDLWGELKGEEFSFDSVRRILEHISSNCSGIYRGGEQQAIRCFNLNLDGSFDAKVICLLGMDEGSFPRKEKVVSLDMSSEVTTEEIDRYLFLQCLMQAEKGLIMSYVHISRSDQQTLLPSLFIQELFSYLGCEPLVMHPHFSPDRAQRGREREEFVSSSLAMRSTIVEVINCKEFKKLANHPVQFYLNHSLGIYVREEPIIRKREGEFILSPIDRAQVRATFGSDCAKVAFPMGVYGEVGRSVVADEMGVINSALQTFGVNREEIYRVDLGKTTKSVRVSFGRKEIEIVGSIPFALCPQGILFYGSDHVKELVRVWPFYLIARLSEDVEPYVLCMKSEKKVSFVVPSVEEALREYIEYYHMCLHSPSPMMPMWSPSLLKGSVDDLEKVMKAKRPFVDSYLDWFLERKGFADLDLVHDMWSLNVKEVFKPMVKE